MTTTTGQTAEAPLPPPRKVHRGDLHVFGLSRHYNRPFDPGIPLQWLEFVPYFGKIPSHVGPISYGVIYNQSGQGAFDYLCGVEVHDFPSNFPELTKLTIPPQDYAVFEHHAHISALPQTLKAIHTHGLADYGFDRAEGPELERYGEEFNGGTGLGGLEIWVPVAA